MTPLFLILSVLMVVALIMAPIMFAQARARALEQKNYERGLRMVPLLINLPTSDDASSDPQIVTGKHIARAQAIYKVIASSLTKGSDFRFYSHTHIAFEIVASGGSVSLYAAVPLALIEIVKQAIAGAYPGVQLAEVSEYNIFNPVGKISGTVGGELDLRADPMSPLADYQDMKQDAVQVLSNYLSTLDKDDGSVVQMLMRPADLEWDQTHSPRYEVLIRVVASSTTRQRAEAIVNNVIAPFALFDIPGKRGFEYAPAGDVPDLVTASILRTFPPIQKRNIISSSELATVFHFPDQTATPGPQLEQQDTEQVQGPSDISGEGLMLGYSIFNGVKKPVRLSPADRQGHLYAVGQAGTGKSSFLENLALQDMLNGDGFAFVDPHGDTAERLLGMVPRDRTEDVIYFCPADLDYPMGLNLLECQTSERQDSLIEEALGIFRKLYDPEQHGVMDPRYEQLFRNAALTAMADPAGGTLLDIPKLFRDPGYLREKLRHVRDQSVVEFWQREVPQLQNSGEFHAAVSWLVGKFGAFLSNEIMRTTIGQTKSSFDLRDIMNNKKILLANLSEGRTGQLNTQLLGMILVTKFQAAAMSREEGGDEKSRPDFCLYVDEFQSLATDSFANTLSEVRKYRLNMIVANQSAAQLKDEVRDAVFGNVSTIMSFRPGQDEDAEILAKRFQPDFDSADLMGLPNYNTVVKALINGAPTRPFGMATLSPLGAPNEQLAAALKQLSVAKYGRPKMVVEKEIFERLVTRPVTVHGGRPFDTPYGSGASLPLASPAAPSSFLDGWQAKRSRSLETQISPWAPSAGQASASQIEAQESPSGLAETPVPGSVLPMPTIPTRII